MESLLGVIQGLTEFLPISSSGHLVIFGSTFENVSLSLITFLHVGTLLAVVFFFRRKIIELFVDLFSGRKEALFYIFYVVIALIPTVILGIPLSNLVEEVVKNRTVVFILLILNGSMLFMLDRIPARNERIDLKSAFIIGLFQILAVFPGISRSGSTIFAGILMGMGREDAFEFSFILSIPTIFGAFLFDYLKNPKIDHKFLPFILSILSGFLSLIILKYFLKMRKMKYFAFYCWIIAFLGLVGLI